MVTWSLTVRTDVILLVQVVQLEDKLSVSVADVFCFLVLQVGNIYSEVAYTYVPTVVSRHIYYAIRFQLDYLCCNSLQAQRQQAAIEELYSAVTADSAHLVMALD